MATTDVGSHQIVHAIIALAFLLRAANLENALLDCVCEPMEPCTGDPQHLHGVQPHAGISQLNDSAALSTVLHVFLALCWAWPGAVPFSQVAAAGNFVT